jgi:hypothetical protein
MSFSKKLTLSSALLLSYLPLYGLNINSGWNLFGSGDSEIDLSLNFSKYENISYIWTYKNGVWSGYGNNPSIQNKLSENSIDKIEKIFPNSGFWVKNEREPIEIDLSFENSIESREIILNPNWTLVSSGGSLIDFNQTFGSNNEIAIIWAFDNSNKVWRAYSGNSTIVELIRLYEIPEIGTSYENSSFWVLSSANRDITLDSFEIPLLKNFDFWGKWKSIDDEKEIYITSETEENIQKFADNLIKVGDSYYLKKGERKVSISGNIVDDGSGEVLSRVLNNLQADLFAKSLVHLRNSRDRKIEANIKVDKNGFFKDSSLPTGDYILTATNGDKSLEANVSLEKDIENLGTFKLVPKGVANFKAFFETNSSFIYGDEKDYNGSIIIKNIGDEVGYGLFYEEINISGSKNLSISSKKILGSVAKSGEKIIPISFSFDQQIENEKFYKIEISLKDSSSRIWNETIEFPVYKTTFDLNLKGEVELTGSLKYPNGKIENLKGDKILYS